MGGQWKRRDILMAGGIVLSAVAGNMIWPSPPSLGKQKKQNHQAPGFFRFNLGTFEITIVSDGNLVLPSKLLAKNAPEAELKALLKSNFLSVNELVTHTNLTLINTGDNLVLIDTGAGANFQKSAGKVVGNLKAAGYSPEDIDTVIITHGHPDHVWGIIDDSQKKPRFPKAEYYINVSEWDFWTNDDVVTKVPEAQKKMALTTKSNLTPVSARTKRVKPGQEILPGITTLGTSGHTPGHMSVMLTSKDNQLLITGDAVSHAYVSFEHPEWHFAFDMDPEQAVKTRKKMLDMAATDELLTIGYHLPFPGVGHVARRGKVYRWVPVTWTWEL